MSNFNVNTFVENQPNNSVDFEADTCLECHTCGAEYHEDVIEENLNITNYLFRDFALAIHNLVYSEKIDQSSFQLMFLKIYPNTFHINGVRTQYGRTLQMG